MKASDFYKIRSNVSVALTKLGFVRLPTDRSDERWEWSRDGFRVKHCLNPSMFLVTGTGLRIFLTIDINSSVEEIKNKFLGIKYV